MAPPNARCSGRITVPLARRRAGGRSRHDVGAGARRVRRDDHVRRQRRGPDADPAAGRLRRVPGRRPRRALSRRRRSSCSPHSASSSPFGSSTGAASWTRAAWPDEGNVRGSAGGDPHFVARLEPARDEPRIAVDRGEPQLVGPAVGEPVRRDGGPTTMWPASTTMVSSPSTNVACPDSTTNTSAYGCVWTAGPAPGREWTRMIENGTSPWSAPTNSWLWRVCGSASSGTIEAGDRAFRSVMDTS